MNHRKNLRIAVFILTATAALARGGESSTAAADPPAIKIFMRISKELFEELTQQEVEMSMPVQKRIEGIPLTGQASGNGTTSIELETSGENADFLVTVTGAATGSLKADVGPAIARMTSRAQFTSQKRFRFDGITFRSEDASTSSRNSTTVDRVCAKRRGPVGRLVECVGRRMANKMTPEINSAAEELSQDMLSETFDDLATELLTELDQVIVFEETVTKYFPETKSWKYRLATRPNYLLAGVGPPGASFPEFLNADDGQTEALVEMWLPLTPGQSALLELAGDFDLVHDLLAEFLSEDEAREIADDVKLVRHGEWSVIQMGLPKLESVDTPTQ